MSVTLPTIFTYQKALSFCSEFMTVYNAFGTKPTDEYAGYMDTMVSDLVSGGYWDRMDLFYVFANNIEANALINWVNPGTFDADNVSSTSFTAYEGFTGDGSEDYISTNYNPSSDNTNYTLDNATVGIYLPISQAEQSKYVFLATDGTNLLGLIPRQTAGNYVAFINSSLSMGGTFAASEGSGLWILTRTASNVCVLYRDNTLIEQESDASSSLPNAELGVLGNIGATYTTHQVSIFFVMNGVTAEEVSAITTIINTYIAAL